MTNKQLNQLEEKALQQFRKGQPLFGKEGAFAPLLKRFLEKALEGEMEAHLGEAERQQGNGKSQGNGPPAWHWPPLGSGSWYIDRVA